MKHLHTALIATMAMIGTTALAIDVSKLPPASARKDITYEKDIKPIFEASCVRCHGGEKKAKGGLRVDSLEALLKGGEEGKVIEAGNAVKSSLLIAVSQLDPEMSMPPKPKKHPAGGQSGSGSGPGGPGNQPPPKPLTPEQVGLVRAWIDQGAK